MKKIIVEKYNPQWQLEFKKAKDFYSQLLNEINCEIEHVGSTAVEGLWAKPILDIDIIVSNSEDSLRVINKLVKVGYEHIGDLGLEGREAFKYSEDNLNINWMAHHLYVCLDGMQHLENHILLRNYLRTNKKSVELYSELKRKLALEFSDDMTSYIDGKTELILGFLKVGGMKEYELNNIEKVNKK